MSRAGRCVNTPQPLAHLIDTSDRQDEMKATPISGLSDADLSRFWEKVSLPDEGGCMLWTSGRLATGYGRFTLRNEKVYAHRVACSLAHGDETDPDMEVKHSCQNRHCVASAHLQWVPRDRGLKPPLAADEFFKLSDVRPDGCWIWTGRIDSCGYGRRGAWGAHRLAHVLAKGPIPDGMSVDHICFTRACVNPDHLRLLTHSENSRLTRDYLLRHPIGKGDPTT